jgi:hypothetical protein
VVICLIKIYKTFLVVILQFIFPQCIYLSRFQLLNRVSLVFFFVLNINFRLLRLHSLSEMTFLHYLKRKEVFILIICYPAFRRSNTVFVFE